MYCLYCPITLSLPGPKTHENVEEGGEREAFQPPLTYYVVWQKKGGDIKHREEIEQEFLSCRRDAFHDEEVGFFPPYFTTVKFFFTQMLLPRYKKKYWKKGGLKEVGWTFCWKKSLTTLVLEHGEKKGGQMKGRRKKRSCCNLSFFLLGHSS